MGNWLRRSYAAHPLAGEGRTAAGGMDMGKRKSGDQPLRPQRRRSPRIKVRMTREQLKEFLARANESGGGGGWDSGGQLGLLIVRECLEGRLPGRVVISDDSILSQCENLACRPLVSIKEEE